MTKKSVQTLIDGAKYIPDTFQPVGEIRKMLKEGFIIRAPQAKTSSEVECSKFGNDAWSFVMPRLVFHFFKIYSNKPEGREYKLVYLNYDDYPDWYIIHSSNTKALRCATISNTPALLQSPDWDSVAEKNLSNFLSGEKLSK